MKERLVEILVYLMSEMTNKSVSDINLSLLEDRGYTQSEISAAFDWLYEHVQIDGGWLVPSVSSTSRRQLHAVERAVIATEGQGYLMQLCELGLLEITDLEMVIERAMVSAVDRVSVHEIQQIVASVLFARQGRSKARPGERRSDGFLIYNNDTIH